MKKLFSLLFVLVLSFASKAWCDTQESANTPNESDGILNGKKAQMNTQTLAVTPKDNNEWTGDHLQLLSSFNKLQDEDKSGTKYFAPAYSRFNVSSENEDGTQVKIIAINNFKKSSDTSVEVAPWEGHNIYGYLSVNKWGAEQYAIPSKYKLITPGTSYWAKKSDIEGNLYVRYGLTYGLLIVPFKYQRNYGTIINSPSYQVYAGYKRESNDSSNGPFASFGIANVDVPTGTGTSSPQTGYSYGIGWIFGIKKGSGFQFVGMIGQDRLGKDSGYKYEGNTWYSVTFGYEFKQDNTNNLQTKVNKQ